MATPVTTYRYTGTAHGYRSSIVGMILGLVFGRKLSQTLPGLADFYMVGQWAGAPGVSPATAMGRDVVRDICRRDRRAFIAATPADALLPRRAIKAAA